jgi:hypothetical protein
MRSALLVLGCLSACSVPNHGWLVNLEGQVLDQDDQGLPGASVQVVSTSSGEPLGALTTDSAGRWSLPVLVEEGEEGRLWPLAIKASASGFGSGQSDWDFSWLNQDWPAGPLSLGPGQFVASGTMAAASVNLFAGENGWTASGEAQHVLTGRPVDEVRLRLRKGWNAPMSAEVLQEQWSTNRGAFSFTVEEQGIYTVEAVGPSGFADTVASFRMGPGASNTQLVLMSPTIRTGELRVALAWKNAQRDLDLHLSGPLAASGGRYQVYVEDTPHPVNGDPVAQVEWAEGRWETLGVYTLRAGAYRFSAFDVDNQLRTGDTSLSQSGANLTLWNENGVWMEQLWPGRTGTLWRGLEFDVATDTVYRLQEMDESRDAWDVSAF